MDPIELIMAEYKKNDSTVIFERSDTTSNLLIIHFEDSDFAVFAYFYEDYISYKTVLGYTNYSDNIASGCAACNNINKKYNFVSAYLDEEYDIVIKYTANYRFDSLYKDALTQFFSFLNLQNKYIEENYEIEK